ncbi:MAG TPA: WecB/TagA/CpsF family glycosyltransferase [Planctomycetes bacterium]|nr:WecB/TagA/CpsF family glycosyltransferase [Planctomycetota bacterium]
MIAVVDYHKVNMLGIDVAAVRMQDVLNICESYITNGSNLLIGVVNVAKLVNCHKNIELRESLAEADVIVADGLPIVWLSKLTGEPVPERIAGIDIMYRLLERASEKNYGVFFLGATQQVVQKVVETVQLKYPGVRIAGYRNGYFKESQENDVAEQIRNSSADILFVAVPTPKKEHFLGKWRDYMNVPVCHGVGGSFDVVAGVTKRAPVWMQKCGMEWFYRLIQEPRKMWKRYLVTNTVFMKIALGQIIRAGFNGLFRKHAPNPASNVRDKK